VGVKRCVDLCCCCQFCSQAAGHFAWKSDLEKAQTQNRQLQTELTTERAQVSRLAGAIKYSVNSDLVFSPGSWQIWPQGRQLIANMAKKLAPTQDNRLLISGYTDNSPIGPQLRAQGVTSNEELSQKRAEAVMEYLVSQGFKADMMTAKGLGDSNPVASNDTASGRAENRRVEISLAK